MGDADSFPAVVEELAKQCFAPSHHNAPAPVTGIRNGKQGIVASPMWCQNTNRQGIAFKKKP